MQIVESGRRSGRTTEQIRALPRGSVFIVHSVSFRKYVERLVAGVHGDTRAIRVVVVESGADVQRLRGLSAPCAVRDHAYYECITGGGRRASWFGELLVVMGHIERAGRNAEKTDCRT